MEQQTPAAGRVARGLAFGGLVTLTSAAVRVGCDGAALSRRAAACVPLRPPSWVFGVVWPALYVTTGLAWARAPRALDARFAAVTALCCAWLVVYLCARARRTAALVLLAATACAAALARRASGALPLALWLAFATYLNAADVLKC